MRGREYAIDRNWNDLKQYEAIEAARNLNDQTALDILRQRAQFGGEMSIFQNNVDASGRANEVAEVIQPGMVANADTRSMAAQDSRSAFINNRGAYQNMVNDTLLANVGHRQNAADAQYAENQALIPYTGQLGVWNAQNTVSQAQANNITAGHQPYRAEQQNENWVAANRLEQQGLRARDAGYKFAFDTMPLVQATQREQLQQQYDAVQSAPAREAAVQEANRRSQELALYDAFSAQYREYMTSKSPVALLTAERLAAEIERMTGTNPLTASGAAIPQPENAALLPPAQTTPPVQPAPPLAAAQNATAPQLQAQPRITYPGVWVPNVGIY